MTQQTPLDRAHAAMEARPDDDTPRLSFYGQLVQGPLFLLLEREVEDDRIEPRLFPLDQGPYVLAFDTEERLADFAAGPAPYAALPGGQVARMLKGQGIGLALNLGGAPSQMLLPEEAVDWLADLVAETPEVTEDRVQRITAPQGLPETLLGALDTALARAGGLAQTAYLCGVDYDGTRKGHLVAFIDPREGAEPVLARAVQSALTFSGIEAGALDVAFFAAHDPMAARLARAGLRFDLPAPPDPAAESQPPGSDPSRPPRLR